MFYSFSYATSTIHISVDESGEHVRVQYPDNKIEHCRTVAGAKRKASAWIKGHPHAGRFWFSIWGNADSARVSVYLARTFDPADYFARQCDRSGYGLTVRRLTETAEYRVHGFSDELGPLSADGSPVFSDWQGAVCATSPH